MNFPGQSSASSENSSAGFLGLDFGKYLISSEKRRTAMESDNTTGTESDTSEWDLANAALTSEYSEDSDEYGIYYGEEHMYDTAIGGTQGHSHQHIGNQMSDRESNLQMRKILNQLNMSTADSGYSGSSSLYPIHETGLTTTDSSGAEENSDDADTGSPVHTGYPVYGRYQKLQSQDNTNDDTLNGDFLDNLMLHRLPGENLGMILGIEGGKDGSGTVMSVAVKSVTLGGAAYRATGSTKGICVGDEIVMVNGMDLRTLSHDECIQVFKDMPLRVLLGIRRGQKDLPAVSVSPLPTEPKKDKFFKSEKCSKSKPDVPVQINRRRDGSDSEDDGFGGFALYKVTIDKEADENLGISIIPSYGSTKEYYQIKRILPSGVAAHTGELQVGDRLITCNGTSLRGLKQNQCLSIIKSGSSGGNLTFEVIRPVYTGNSMEISVTLNNGTNSYSKLSTRFDPSQYSLKSQSYDRNVDVVVTSESDEYLTVSEDEYSRTGRLEDIPEAEAHEVFVDNKVRLAYQAPLNTLEEESTETETENSPRVETVEGADVDVVDLNKFDTSPYHIPHKQKSKDKQNSFELKQYKIVPKSEKNQNNSLESKSDLHQNIPKSELDAISLSSVSPRSPLPRSDLDRISPRSPVPRSDLDQISPRSPVPRSDLDQISPRSPVPRSYLDQISPRSPVPRSDLDQISPRSPVPRSDLDQISSRSPVPKTDLDSARLASSYTKRQQVPTDSETSYLSLPYNYPPESVGHSIPVSDSEETRYNPLYEDSNLSDFTDSEPQDYNIEGKPFRTRDSVYNSEEDKLSVGSDQTLTQKETGLISEGSDTEDIAVPPPVEFSDNQPDLEENPVTYIDDILRENSASLEASSENITFAQTPNQLDLNPEQHSFENDDENGSEDERNAHLAFSAELTAPFDLVLQEQGICVQSDKEEISDIEESHGNEILQVVTSYDNGTVLISQFEPDHFEDRTDSPVYCVTKFETSDNKMDQNSEAMLKDALDMEYENLPDSVKYEARLKLGANVENGDVQFEDPSYSNENIVAENIAKDITRNEQGNYGYYVESDEEPDEFPEADAPEEAPDLPDMPPPILNNIDSHLQNDVTVTVNGSFGNEKPDVPDDNWTFRTKTIIDDKENLSNNTSNQVVEAKNEPEVVPVKIQRKVEIPISHGSNDTAKKDHNGDGETDVIVPVKVQRKVEIPIGVSSKGNENEDVIVPLTAKRDFQLPSTFSERIPSPRNDDEGKDVVTVLSKKKVPPPVSPKPKRNVPHKNIYEDDVNDNKEIVQEEIISPSDVKKVTAKNLVNVISVVNALKAKAKDKDPDEIDKIEKQDAKDRVKPVFSSVIKVDGKRNNPVEQSPPKVEQVVTSRAEISFSGKPRLESSPPKQDVIEVTKEVITKPVKQKPEETLETVIENKPVQSDTVVPKLKTSITVEKPKVDTEIESIVKQTETSPTVVPRLNLNFQSGDTNDSISPKSDKSDKKSPTATYKTTIGVPKPETNPTEEKGEPVSVSPVALQPDKAEIKIVSKPKEQEKPALAPTPQIKSLSQIKPLSFNPKTLSQTSSRSVQYKTTVGVKPGLSSFSKPLTSSQKVDHPIKRMETMPFEVSILKGILGIGIKTTMTPEGYVKVTEILPNGPVGREGNIKVGDYILSINGTELTSLTDGKVQQILRLLPRGLSKIVASAVIPDQNAEKPAPEAEKPMLAARQSLPPKDTEKTKLSPRQSSPLSSPRQTTVTTNPNAAIHLPQQPVAVPRSLPIQQSTQKVIPPPVAPRPASRTTSSPGVSPRSPNVGQGQTARSEKWEIQSPASSSSASPIASPRQKEPQPHSPRTPPAVAPKPKRSPSKKTETQVDDPTKPIDAELFVSINSTNESAPDIGRRNILPGSVNYDVAQGVSKTNWTAGVVSSEDLRNPEKQVDSKGNVDVVDVTKSLKDDIVIDTVSLENNVVNITDSTDTDAANGQETDSALITENPVDAVTEAVEKLNEIEQDLETSQVDVSLLSNRSRTFSSSSNASSYNEFTECNVEGENIPEDIAEEDEIEFKVNLDIEKSKTNKDDEYESDFEDGENDDISKEETDGSNFEDNRIQSPDSGLDMDRLKSLAENIVTDVITSIKNSDFEFEDTKKDESETTETVTPALPQSPPPAVDDNIGSETEAPTLPDSPPPLPISPVPVENQTKATVVDLALYPDSDQSSDGTGENKTDQGEKEVSEVIDVVDVSVSTTLHAAAPVASTHMNDFKPENDFENKIENVIESKAENDTVDVFVDKTELIDNTEVEHINPADIQDDTSLSQVIENDTVDVVVDKTELIDNTEVEPIIPADIQDDTSLSQVIEDSKDQEGDVNIEDNDEQSVNNVITMYSNLEKSLEEKDSQSVDNIIETNNNVINKDVNLAVEEQESRDPKSLTSSDDIVSKEDSTSGLGTADTVVENRNFSENILEKKEKELDDSVKDKVNGHVSPVLENSTKTPESRKDDNGLQSPISDTESPRSERKFKSRVDRILSETEEPARGKCSPETDKMFRMLSTSDEPTPVGEGELIDVIVNKGVTGLGFIIQGGKGTPKGDLPITIKRIFKGGPADGVLQVQDELCSVNGEALSDMRHSEAWNHLKFLTSGDIAMKIRRYQLENDD